MATKYSLQKKNCVLNKTNGRCAYCGAVLSNDSFTIDHVIPKHHGGNNAIENLLASCRMCNTTKGTKTIEQWRRFYAVKKVTGAAIFGQEQVDYLYTKGLFPALGANESFRFYFQTLGEQS
ncbi:HNH endonuclease [Salmonella enterica]